MWIRILRQEKYQGQRYAEGMEVDIPDAAAETLISVGSAERIPPRRVSTNNLPGGLNKWLLVKM